MPASAGPLLLPLFSAVAAPLRLTVVATAPAAEPGDEDAADPLAPRPRTDKRADDAPADDEVAGADGAAFDAPPPEVAGLDAATSAAEGPPEPPRGGRAPPPPDGCAGCQGAERPVWELPDSVRGKRDERRAGVRIQDGRALARNLARSSRRQPAPEGASSGTTIPIGTELTGAAGALAMGVVACCAC